MALSTKNVFRYAAGLIVLVIGCGAWFVNDLPITDRDLTEAELAGIHGRQPLPPGGKVKCDPCKLVENKNACHGNNPCPDCVTDEESTCGEVSFWDFSNDDVGRSPTYVAGQPEKEFVNVMVFCNGEYECIVQSQVLFAICSEVGCFPDMDHDCSWCAKGLIQGEGVTQKPLGRCDPCPP